MAKTTATDVEVGRIHKKINTIIERVADSYLKQLEDPEADANLIVNMKDLGVMIAWTEKNGITAQLEIDEEGSKVNAKLQNIKDRVGGRKLTFVEPTDDVRKAG